MTGVNPLEVNFSPDEDAAIADTSAFTGLPAEEIVRALTLSGLMGADHPTAAAFWSALGRAGERQET